jgi:transposase-like protein
MKYHIASDEQIRKSLDHVLKKYRTINSQFKLRNLVNDDLKSNRIKYTVSPQRLRNIAVQSNFVKLEIHTREGDPKKIMTKCPVCSSSLNRVKNLTIWGGEVTIEFNCSKCGYWTGKKKRIPTRYIFHKK